MWCVGGGKFWVADGGHILYTSKYNVWACPREEEKEERVPLLLDVYVNRAAGHMAVVGI